MRYFALIGFALFLVILMIGVQAQEQQNPLSDKEEQLANLINQYRVDNGLSAVPITNSLTKVARTHIADLNTYHPDAGDECDMHSWSNHGDWTAVCYTGAATMSLMHSKPREITDGIYEGNGYEIAAYGSPEITPELAIDTWRSSTEGHNDVILNLNNWADRSWKVMGVGIGDNYAVVWFGEDVDPAGSVPITSEGPETGITSEDYPDIQRDCTFSYCTDINVLHRCDNGIEKIVEQGCFLGLFGPPNEQFRVGSGPNAFADNYYAEFKVDVLGKAQAARDAPKLIILIDKTLDRSVDLADDSQFKINDKPARKLKDFDDKSTDEGRDKFLYKLAVSDLHTGTNTLLINPKGDDFAIYKMWIENAKGERIWQVKNDECTYQSECKFDDRYNPYQLACDFTETPHKCKEKKGSGEPCKKNFECVSGTCSANNVCT
ncbi:MAG: hypothetical protein MUO26_15500 [Methanotrichaceae archaeon]|nr:hypothetical protein [Methanotrichaceae archaeon]